MDVVILVGLPASGKTSFYREHFAATHHHVSKDLIRNNRRPQRRQEQLLAESLAAGRSVVVDNTHPSAASRAAIIAIAHQFGARVIGYYFATTAADALRRNRARDGRARVPDVAIFTARKYLEPPSRGEGFDELYTVTLNEQEQCFVVQAADDSDAAVR